MDIKKQILGIVCLAVIVGVIGCGKASESVANDFVNQGDTDASLSSSEIDILSSLSESSISLGSN